MKNILLPITLLAFATGALADQRVGVYFKANAGINKMNNAKELTDDNAFGSIVSKSKISPSLSVGFGSYINDFIRADLMFSYNNVDFKDSKLKFKSIEPDLMEYKLNGTINREASIYSAMLNGYVDLPIADSVKFFVGAGGGLAQIREKVSSRAKVTRNDGYVIEEASISESFSSKRKTNFAYSLTAGTALSINPRTNIELAYVYQDFGKTKYKKCEDGEPDHNHYRGHSLLVGIRFNV